MQSNTRNTKMPYVVVFPGDTGNFGNRNPDNAGRNDYCHGVPTREAVRLAIGGTCVRAVAVETSPSYACYVRYPRAGFDYASLSGASDIYLPMTNGAAAIFNITRDIFSSSVSSEHRDLEKRNQ